MTESVNRRKFLQLGLSAGAGLALWEVYRVGMTDRAARAAAAPLIFQQAGLDEEGLRRIIALALENGGVYADVFLEHSMSSYLGFDGERVQDTGFESISGAAVRVVAADGRTAFRATSDLTWEGLRNAAREAANATHRQPRPNAAAFKRLAVPDLYAVNAPSFDQPFKEKLEYMRRAVAAAQNADPNVRGAQAHYRDSLRFLTIATSTGVIAYDTQPLLKISVSARALKEKNGQVGMGTFSGGGHYGFEYFQTHTPERLGQRAAEIARNQLDAVDAPAGELPVVLGPAYSGVLLHEAVGHGLEADINVKGYSNYANRMGQLVASPLCTIVDDGRRPNLNGSINFDDEGVASASTTLIERGRLVGYLHNRETARQMKTAPTGNGRRQGFSVPPLPRMTNTYLQSGETAPADVIRSVKRGIYARAFSGGSVNITTGDFTFEPVEAYLIEAGRITAPVSNMLLLGNGPEILKRISMVGNDMEISDNLWECGKQGQMIPVTVGTPTIKVDAMTVGGTFQK